MREDLSSSSSHPCEKPGVAEYASVTPGLEDKDRETCGACRLLVEIRIQ